MTRLGRSKIGAILFGIGFVALLPVMLPVALAQHQLRNRRIRKLAEGFACEACGTTLGAQALRLADERWAKIVANRQASAPGMRFRMVRDVDAICPSCGRGYLYRDADRSFATATTAPTAPP